MMVMDCTLRDGANVVGKGFDARLTKMMIEGMISAGITTIEMGNCLGLGAYKADKCGVSGADSALSSQGRNRYVHGL